MYSKAKVVRLKEILTLFSKQSTSNGNYFPNLLPPKCGIHGDVEQLVWHWSRRLLKNI